MNFNLSGITDIFHQFPIPSFLPKQMWFICVLPKIYWPVVVKLDFIKWSYAESYRNEQLLVKFRRLWTRKECHQIHQYILKHKGNVETPGNLRDQGTWREDPAVFPWQKKSEEATLSLVPALVSWTWQQMQRKSNQPPQKGMIFNVVATESCPFLIQACPWLEAWGQSSDPATSRHIFVFRERFRRSREPPILG